MGLLGRNPYENGVPYYLSGKRSCCSQEKAESRVLRCVCTRLRRALACVASERHPPYGHLISCCTQQDESTRKPRGLANKRAKSASTCSITSISSQFSIGDACSEMRSDTFAWLVRFSKGRLTLHPSSCIFLIGFLEEPFVIGPDFSHLYYDKAREIICA